MHNKDKMLRLAGLAPMCANAMLCVRAYLVINSFDNTSYFLAYIIQAYILFLKEIEAVSLCQNH